MKSPAREATSQVPVGLMAPAGESVLTPLGDMGCAATDAVMTARTPIARSMDLNISRSHRLQLRPRPRCLRLFLEARDLVFLHQGEPDVIEAVQQAVLTVRIDFEPDHAAVGTAYLLLFEVDGEARIGAALGIVEQLFQIFRGHLDGQHAVLETIVVEDVAERGRNYAGDAEVLQRPGSVLTRRTATEIVAGDKNLGIAIGWFVEHKIRVLAAVVAVALLREQTLAEAGSLYGLEVLLGNDGVGIDIDRPQGRRDPLQNRELLHTSSPNAASPRGMPPDYIANCEHLEHVPIEFAQQLAHLAASPAGLSRGSRFIAKIIGMAGTSPAMTLHVWFDLTETRSSYRFSPEKGRKPLVSAAVVMNAESGSVKTVRVGRVVSGVSGSPALARVVASGRLALKISAGRVGAVDSLDGALDC